ncbi:hypothetical protein AB0M28_28475 [Streptomyces sp. NPDC051940]|uniref:hypothetical protein n=1 Tax=Streptomyces sp. NPDC051940 TaxID=3155675 RepID=UPI00342956DC
MTVLIIRASAPLVALVAGVSLLLVGCGEQQAGDAADSQPAAGSKSPDAETSAPGTVNPSNLVPDGYLGRFRAAVSVLENPAHGPQMCEVMTASLPPMCGGPDIVGWDWKGLKSAARSGTRWGSYVLTGTWDGHRFTLTEPARDADEVAPLPDPEKPDFSTPCDEPEGGWQRAKPGQDQTPVFEAAQMMDGYAGAWIDDHRGERSPEAAFPVLNFRFTGDLDTARSALRKMWSGPLCVTSAEHTYKELERIRDSLVKEMPELMSASIDGRGNGVKITTWAPTEKLQRTLDERHGEGVVALRGLLEPID